ncbi:MAG TPA: hypothetical protein VHX86_14180 [Tepidisphaeraceae bacterium]|jgi:hypothetical protein|nr:hypothetical protein [Tepidisphaeraceae bacterium]
MAIIKVFRGQFAINLGYPTLLVNGRVDETVGLGEAFLILLKPPIMQYSIPFGRIFRMPQVLACLKLVSLGNDDPPTAEEYMFKMTSDWAKAQWEHLKFLQFEKTPVESLVLNRTEFVEENSWQNELARHWFAGLPRDLFEQIMKGTRVNEIAQFMNKLQNYTRPQDEPI